jgi:N-formylglutamate amidohydrolase
MIEINKRLYMDERTLMKNKEFEKLRKEIQALYSILLFSD